MRVVVVSDTHGLRKPLDYLLEKYPDAAAFIHCGDICFDSDEYPQILTVCGNNDYYDYPYERIIKVGNHRIVFFHSHLFGYLKRNERMIARAKEENCDIICYGHTHVAECHIEDGITILNPGSFFHSRDGRPPSYALIDIDGDDIKVEIKFVESL